MNKQIFAAMTLACSVAVNATTIQWEPVDGATHYEVEISADSGATWSRLTDTDAKRAINLSSPSFEVTGQETGEYTVRVSGCVNEPNVQIHCGENVAGYAQIGISLQAVTAVSVDYKYDALGRLIEVRRDNVIDEEYQYDKAGNRKTVTKQ